jgi:uncharacterized membrane protein
MRTPTSFKGHPLHPILVALPIGLLFFSLVSDIIYMAGWGQDVWKTVALYNLGGGIVAALVAAVPGLIDLIAIDDPMLKRTGLVHMGIMLVSVAIFAADFWLRIRPAESGNMPFILSVLGNAVMLIGGWVGGKLVHVFGVTVEERTARSTAII